VKAIVIDHFGGPEVLQLREIADLAPGPGEALIRTAAAGVNFGEIIIREGGAPRELPLPFIPGSEAAGTVAAIGEGVTEYAIGDRVAVPLFFTGRLDGGYAEQIVAPAAILARLPAEVSFEQAAAVQLQGMTALGMVEHISPKGKTVLIHAGAGGVGSYLVQLARLRGASKVIATAGSADKRAVARRIGADVAIDYTQPGWTEQLLGATDGAGPDVIYDSVGGQIRQDSLAALAAQGTYVIYGAAATGALELIGADQLIGMYMKCQSVAAFSLWPVLQKDGALRGLLEELFELLIAGHVTPLIGQRYKLAEAAHAHKAMRDRATTGKTLLLP
jgi:NADPH:quinone reductase